MATITVIGTGFVGLTTAALFANSGHKVFAVDVNHDKLSAIKEGRSFFYEQGLDALIKKAINGNKLVATSSYSESIPDSDFIFSCVGTPDKPDGSSNLEYVFNAADQASKFLKPGSIYIQKSTVPVGTGQKVMKLLPSNCHYVSNPEFLKEGTAVNDSLFFDRIVVGGNEDPAKKVINLYKSIDKSKEDIMSTSDLKSKQYKGEYILTSLNSAELIKVSANAFLALKISFANSIAKLADQTGADIKEVMDAVGADNRIGKAFLNAGRGYGGGCFPKDVSGLIASAREHNVDTEIMSAAVKVNDSMASYIVSCIKNVLGSLDNKQIAVLGLAFKPGTSDTRRSPAIKLANLLVDNGAKVKAYDPKANEEAKSEISSDVEICESKDEAIKNTEAIILATDWPEFIDMDIESVLKNYNGTLFVDCMNRFNPELIKKSGLRYLGVGRN